MLGKGRGKKDCGQGIGKGYLARRVGFWVNEVGEKFDTPHLIIED